MTARKEGEGTSSSHNTFLAQVMIVVTTVPIQHTIVFPIAKILQAQQIPKKRNGMAKSGNRFSLLAQKSLVQHAAAMGLA